VIIVSVAVLPFADGIVLKNRLNVVSFKSILLGECKLPSPGGSGKKGSSSLQLIAKSTTVSLQQTKGKKSMSKYL